MAGGRRWSPKPNSRLHQVTAPTLGQTYKLAVACFIVPVVGTNLRDESRSHFVALSGDIVAVGNGLFYPLDRPIAPMKSAPNLTEVLGTLDRFADLRQELANHLRSKSPRRDL
jgi:hypothetical protein